MANTLTQRIAVQGGDEIKQTFLDLGRAGQEAFRTISQAAQGLSSATQGLDFNALRQRMGDLVNAAGGVSKALGDTGKAAASAQKNVNDLASAEQNVAKEGEASSSILSNLGTTIAVTTAGVIGLGTALFGAAKNAADLASKMGVSAASANATLKSYQESKFALEQLGLSGSEAEQVLTSMGTNVQNTMKKVADQLKSQGSIFAPTEQGAEAARTAIASMGGAQALLDPLKKKLSDLGLSFPPTEQGAKDAAEMLGRLGGMGEALGTVVSETKNATDQLKLYAEIIASIKDPVLASALSVKIFGQDISTQLAGGSEAIDKFVARFHEISGAGVTEPIVDAADKFDAAMAELSTASEQGRIQFGSLFLPVATEAVKGFTDLITLNRNALRQWASELAGSVRSIVEDFFKLLNGQDSRVDNKWLLTLRDAILAIGTGATQVFNNVLLPAFAALKSAAQPAIDAINSLFGTNFNAASLGIAAVLASLIGGFNALALGVVAVFGGSGPQIAAFKEKLRSLGIDVDAIKQGFVDAYHAIVAMLTTAHQINAGPFGQFSVSAAGITEVLVGAVAAILALKKAADLAAPVISRLIGREVSGGAVALATAVLDATGALNGLKTVAEIAGFVMLALADGLRAVVIAVEAMVKWNLALGLGIITLLANFKAFAAVLSPVASALNDIFGTQFFNGAKLAEAALATLIVIFGVRLVTAIGIASKALFLLVARNPWLLLITGAAALAAWIANITGDSKKLDGAFESLRSKGQELAGAVNQSVGLAGKGFDALAKGVANFGITSANAAESVGQIGETFNGFKRTADGVWEKIGDDAKQASADSAQAGSSISDRISAAFSDVAKSVATVTQQVPTLAQSLGSFASNLSSQIGSVGESFTGMWGTAMAGADATIAKISQLSAVLSQLSFPNLNVGSGGGGGDAGGFATGGLFRGKPGKDTNLAWLTDFEFVLRPEAVKKYGVGFLRAINALALPLDSLRGFSVGGLVEGINRSLAIPGFADGGLNLSAFALAAPAAGPRGRPITLVLDGRRFAGLSAPDDVADKLLRAARGHIRASAGRAPSRVR